MGPRVDFLGVEDVKEFECIWLSMGHGRDERITWNKKLQLVREYLRVWGNVTTKTFRRKCMSYLGRF